MRTLIIDDEPAARDDLRRLLAAHPEVEVLGEAGRFAEAEELLATADYQLVLLDVELRGGTGFELLPRVRPEARVIFVTAHSQYAVRAFEVNAVDYLVKPITAARLEAALRRVEPNSAPPFADSLTQGDLVYLRIGNGTTRFIPLADIAAIESAENYTAVVVAGGNRLMVRRTLKSWEEALPPAQFVRVHRATIINLARYRGSDRQTDETTLLHLDGLTEPVRGSFRYLHEVRQRFASLGWKI